MLLQLNETSRKNLNSCVHCGFCLAVCPTYDQLGIEDDSPRGRLHLIRSLAAGTTDASPKVLAHLDLCLDCRACEAACPAGVKYGGIIEDARTQLEASRKRSFFDSQLRKFFMRWIFSSPERLRGLARALRLTQNLGLDRLAVVLGIIRGRLAAMAQAARVPARFGSDVVPEMTPGQHGPRYKVAFLQGCVGDVMFGPTNEATVRVLAANDCQVAVPAGQCCCGGLAFHMGDMEQARRQARRNIDVFLSTDADYYLTNAAGCGSTLKEYAQLLAGDPDYADPARRFVARVRDISEFLAEIELIPPEHPVVLKVTYQDACHLAHGQGIRSQPRKLLSQIPGLELVPLKDSDTCCGSAGIYNLVQPEMADALLKKKMISIAATGAQAVAMGNPGCMMQLRVGVRQYGPKVEVVHVVDLLDRAYRGNGNHG